jgi:hypothetical protein
VASERTLPEQLRGYTPREAAYILRISKDRVRALIVAGRLGAIDQAPSRYGRRRYIIMPEHLRAYVRSREVTPPPKPAPRRRRPVGQVDYFPDP